MNKLLCTISIIGLTCVCGCTCPPADDGGSSATTMTVDDTTVDLDVPAVDEPVVGDPCFDQDDCANVPGGLYCVPEHKICSVSCVTEADCQPGIAGTTCVGGWCGIPCDELSPHQCWLLDPSAQCITAAGREMCGYI
jgi:hypothetical protein